MELKMALNFIDWKSIWKRIFSRGCDKSEILWLHSTLLIKLIISSSEEKGRQKRGKFLLIYVKPISMICGRWDQRCSWWSHAVSLWGKFPIPIIESLIDGRNWILIKMTHTQLNIINLMWWQCVEKGWTLILIFNGQKVFKIKKCTLNFENNVYENFKLNLRLISQFYNQSVHPLILFIRQWSGKLMRLSSRCLICNVN